MTRITRRTFLRYWGGAAVGSTFLISEYASSVMSATPANILLIAADDLGQQLGCYGDKRARTPNLNKLASQGIRFVNSYVTQASCSSSRSSLFTGLYPHQTGFFPPDNTPVGQIGLAYQNSGYAMDPRIITLPQLLKAAGYRTGIIGKLHVFPEASFPFDYKQPDINARDIKLMAQQAEEFFLKKPKQPFFLMLSYSDPHEPFYTQVNGYPQKPFGPAEVPPFPWVGQKDTPALRKKTAGYYNGVARLDAGIGMLLNKLTHLGLDNNTMVILIGDHGPSFNRAKMTCYEAGLRVPLLIRWPGRISPNTINKSLVSSVDILPTVLQAAGVTVPQNLAGRSLMQLFQGNNNWRKLIYAEYTSHTRDLFNPSRCIRGLRYKYIRNLMPNQPPNNGREEQLYDLQTDPYEFNNLAYKLEYQDFRNVLRLELQKWRQQTGDPLLNSAVLQAMIQQHYGVD